MAEFNDKQVRPDLLVNVNGVGMAFRRDPVGLVNSSSSYHLNVALKERKKADAWALSRMFNLEELGLKYVGKRDSSAFGREMSFVPVNPNGISEAVVRLSENDVCLNLIGTRYTKKLQGQCDEYASQILPVLTRFVAKRAGYVSERKVLHR
jgi:hypothetical protein